MSAFGRARPGFSWPLALAFVGVGAVAGVVAHIARSDFDHRGFVRSPDGLRLAYEVQGEGLPLVALAGGPGISHHAFHPHLARLRHGARIIYFDPRGRGDSDPGSYSVAADVADLDALRHGLRLGRLDLLGASYGAHLALAYALEHPEAVRKLVLVSPIVGASAWRRHLRAVAEAPDMGARLARIRAARGEARLTDRAAFKGIAETIAPLYRCRASGWSSVPAAFRPRHHLPRQNPEVYEAIVGRPFPELNGELARSDLAWRLGEIHAPVLIVQGGCDRAVPEESFSELERALPRSRRIVLPESGHAPFADEVERFAAEVSRFLAES
jgi:proline iminopeptidase